MESIIDLDRQLLLAINHWTSPWADSLMTIMSAVRIWFPMYLLVGVAMFIPKAFSPRSIAASECSNLNRWIAGVAAVCSVLLCCLLTDQVSAIVRDAVCRLRPGQDAEIGSMVRLIAGPGNRYGFYSGHAANSTGFAMITSLLFRRRAWTIFSSVWAALVCYSRMYLGQHFPLDVLTGILSGIIFAAANYALYKFAMRALAAGRQR